MKPTPQAHHVNATAIITAILKAQGLRSEEPASPEPLQADQLRPYQRHLLGRFADIICKPSFEYISKVGNSWLIVGDRRKEIAADIALIIERHGLGIGILVLHLQQLQSGHIPTRFKCGNAFQDLAIPTERLEGANGEQVLYVPIRRFRGDMERLAQNNIAKPPSAWDTNRIVTHERDRNPCFYCSSGQMNPTEVVINLDRSRHGVSRHYCLGFTYAPFGNPLSVVHFLAWDRAPRPLNMNRVPMTVSDLVKLTREINLSICSYFAEKGVCGYPVVDGVSNGWAGNTIFHQHFQFYAPESPTPIAQVQHAGRTRMISREDVIVQRLRWLTPVYRIRTADALNTGLIGNDLAGIWRLLGGSRKVPYKSFRDGYTPTERERVHAHTQNLYVPGRDLGTSAYIVLRDRELVDFRPAAADFINVPRGLKAQRKDNIGVLEATGTLIVDDPDCFESMKTWEPADISAQIHKLIAAISPDGRKVHEFEVITRDLFPY
jgi:hypothetical protein